MATPCLTASRQANLFRKSAVYAYLGLWIAVHGLHPPNTSPKLHFSKTENKYDHSTLLKAFSASGDSTSAGRSCSTERSPRSNSLRMLSAACHAFMQPDWSGRINWDSRCPNLCAINFDIILKSTGSSKMGRIEVHSAMSLYDITAVFIESGRIPFSKKSISVDVKRGSILGQKTL